MGFTLNVGEPQLTVTSDLLFALKSYSFIYCHKVEECASLDTSVRKLLQSEMKMFGHSPKETQT